MMKLVCTLYTALLVSFNQSEDENALKTDSLIANLKAIIKKRFWEVI